MKKHIHALKNLAKQKTTVVSHHVDKLFEDLKILLRDDDNYPELFNDNSYQAAMILKNIAGLAKIEIPMNVEAIENFIQHYIAHFVNVHHSTFEILFEAVRELVIKDAVIGRFTVPVLEKMMHKFSLCDYFTSRNMSLCILTLNTCIDKNKLVGSIHAQCIEQVLAYGCKNGDLYLDNVAKSLYGIGRIINMGYLNGTIPTKLIEDALFQISQNRDITSKEIGISFYGLRFLVRNNILDTKINDHILNGLIFSLLRNGDSSLITIFNTIQGLIQCLKQDYVDGFINGDLLFQLILDGLNKTDIQQDIDELALNLGQLLTLGKFDSPFHYHDINRLFTTLATKDYHQDSLIKFLNAMNLGLKNKKLQKGIDIHLVNAQTA